jgi:hypothetical protein
MKADKIRLSFWFMRDNHTFIKPKGRKLNRIAKEMLRIAKDNPYGMLCPVTLLIGNKELSRVGLPVHVDSKGNVDIDKWINSIKGEHSFDEIGIVETYKITIQ